MSETEEQPNVDQPIQLDKSTAIAQVLDKASTRGVLVKGIGEVCKALEAQKVKVIFLASDCDREDYKNTVRSLANLMKVPVIDVDKWEMLKEKLGVRGSRSFSIARARQKDRPNGVKIRKNTSQWNCILFEYCQEKVEKSLEE